ncbi:MAG: pseudouridine-5'-phosphate glycosidase [Pseudomonadota bacterium]
MNLSEFLYINPKIKDAIQNNKPVVALESTIIAHGMPYPQNLETALMLESIIKDTGCVPATIAILDGRIVVGLSLEEVEKIAQGKDILKVSAADISYVLGKDLSGATTAGATMKLACLAGIRVFATGGIGGVHRGVENTFDISSDLKTISETPIITVSAGAKAILDLPKTLEHLETLNVLVLGYQTNEFPAFYSRESGLKLNHSVIKASEIASIFSAQKAINENSGILVANPIPEEFEIKAELINSVIDKAILEAKNQGVSGKELTPFLLKYIKDKTSGESLKANIELVKNNVKLACEIAKLLVAGC